MRKKETGGLRRWKSARRERMTLAQRKERSAFPLGVLKPDLGNVLIGA